MSYDDIQMNICMQTLCMSYFRRGLLEHISGGIMDNFAHVFFFLLQLTYSPIELGRWCCHLQCLSYVCSVVTSQLSLTPFPLRMQYFSYPMHLHMDICTLQRSVMNKQIILTTACEGTYCTSFPKCTAIFLPKSFIPWL